MDYTITILPLFQFSRQELVPGTLVMDAVAPDNIFFLINFVELDLIKDFNTWTCRIDLASTSGSCSSGQGIRIQGSVSLKLRPVDRKRSRIHLFFKENSHFI